MTVISYQSKLVLRILKAGETYRAKPNLTLRGEYNAMIDLLGLHCECPIFGVLKGKKQNTGGKVSVRRYNEILADLQEQRKPSQYQCPQVVLEKIDPAWLKSYHIVGKGEGFLRKLFGR